MNSSYRSISTGALRTTLVLTLLCPLANAADISWSNPVTGSFSDSTLWTGGVVPTTTDNAIVPAGTVNIAADWSLTAATAATTATAQALFSQTAGNFVLTGGDLTLGAIAGATGSYELTGGKLSTNSNIRVGAKGAGTWKISSDVEQTLAGPRIVVGDRSEGVVGTLPAEDYSDFASNSSTGSVVHTAGTLTTAAELWVGLGSGGTGAVDAEGGHSDVNFGTYELSGTGLLTSKNWLVVGRTGGEGLFTMKGGTINKTADAGSSFVVGSYDAGHSSTHGTFAMTGGTINSAAPLNIGNGSNTGAVLRGYGTFNLSGDTSAVTVSNTLSVGRLGGVGVFNVSGGTFTRNTAGNSYVGDGTPSDGTLNQTGGTVNISTGEFRIANGIDATNTIPSKGVYNLSGGALNVSGTMSIGRVGGTGTLNVTGGTLTRNTGGNTVVGDGSFSVGAVKQTSGLVDIQNGELWLGQAQTVVDGVNTGVGKGSYTLSGDGVLNLNNWLAVGRQGGQGVLTVSGGTINKAGAGNITIGATGNPGSTGIVNQSGGVINNTTATWLGEGVGTATWNLSGTGLANLTLLSIGQSGSASGTFNLDGGTLQATQISSVSNVATFNFNGGVLKPMAGDSDAGSFFRLIVNTMIKAGGAIIDTNGFNVSIDSNIQSGVATGLDGGLTKNGSGRLRIDSFGNSFTGPTTINAGTLALDLTALDNSSQVTVKKDANLEIAGGANINGPVTMNGNLLFSGTSASTLNLSGNLTLSSTSLMAFRIDSANLASDAISSGKTLTLGGAKLSISSIDGNAMTIGKQYTLMSTTGTLSGTFANAANNATITSGNSTFKIQYTTKAVTVTVLSSTAQTAYDSWASLNGLTAANNARSADPDNDGLPNYAEFALASSPTAAGNGGSLLTRILQIDASTKALAVTLPVRNGASFSGTGAKVSAAVDGVIYTIQGSTDLADFATMAVSEVTGVDTSTMPVLPDGWTYRTFRAPGTGTREFLRVKIDDASN